MLQEELKDVYLENKILNIELRNYLEITFIATELKKGVNDKYDKFKSNRSS